MNFITIKSIQKDYKAIKSTLFVSENFMLNKFILKCYITMFLLLLSVNFAPIFLLLISVNLMTTKFTQKDFTENTFFIHINEFHGKQIYWKKFHMNLILLFISVNFMTVTYIFQYFIIIYFLLLSKNFMAIRFFKNVSS